MDLASALVPLGASRKKLNRFAAALRLDCESNDPGSLAVLMEAYSRDANRVKREIRKCLAADAPQKKSKKVDDQINLDLLETLEAALDEWCQNGVPQLTVEAEDATTVHEHDPRSTLLAAGHIDASCCVECRSPTSYVFELLDNIRLCQKCEKQNPRKYQLLAVDLAKEMYGLTDSDLRSLSSKFFECGGQRRLAALKSDVEILARTAGDKGRKQEASEKEWRENSFRTDHKGHTHKWKEWNSGTFQRKKQIGKQGSSGLYAGHEAVEAREEDLMMSMFELSGLKFVGA